MSVERTRRFQVRGAQQYTPGGEVRLDFNDLSPLSLGHTYVRWVELAVDVRFNSAAGAATVPEPVAHNIIKSIKCGFAGGHTFFDLSSQAGEALFKAIWIANGKRPESPGDIAVGAGGVANARLKVMLPIGYLYGALEPDDYNVPLRELQRGQASIEIQWANGAAGGDFDTGGGDLTVVGGGVTQIRQATVVMIARPEARVGPYLTYKTQVLSGVEERPLAANHVLHHLIEIPTANGPGASALTEVFVTAAGRTQVDELSFDGINVVEQVPAADLITVYNRRAATAADRITQHEAGTTEALPIYSPATSDAKITQLPSSRDHPNLKVAGSTATPRILMVLSRLVDDRAFTNSASLMGVQADPMNSVAKTSTKTDLPRSSGAGAFMRLPRKLAA